MPSTPIIADPALTVHRSWCDQAKCRADRQGADNTGDLEAIIHHGQEYGFITEPDDTCAPADRLTVQLEEFDDLKHPASIAVVLSNRSESIELNLYDLQRLKYLLTLAEDQLIDAMTEQEAREDGNH